MIEIPVLGEELEGMPPSPIGALAWSVRDVLKLPNARQRKARTYYARNRDVILRKARKARKKTRRRARK